MKAQARKQAAWMLGIVLLFCAQESTAQVLQTAARPQSYLQAADYTAVTYLPPYPEDPRKRPAQTALFEIAFSDDFPAEARAAFQYAADIWACYLRSDVAAQPGA